MCIHEKFGKNSKFLGCDPAAAMADHGGEVHHSGARRSEFKTHLLDLRTLEQGIYPFSVGFICKMGCCELIDTKVFTIIITITYCYYNSDAHSAQEYQHSDHW